MEEQLSKKETLPSKVAQYFITNNLTKQHIRIILINIFQEYDSKGIYVQLWNSLRKSPIFSFLGHGWIGFNLPKEDSEIRK